MTLHLGGQCGLEHLRGAWRHWPGDSPWWAQRVRVSPHHPRTRRGPSPVCWPPRSDHTNGRIPWMRRAMIAALNSPATGTVTNQATKMLRKRRQSTAFRERIQPTATTEPTWRSTGVSERTQVWHSPCSTSSVRCPVLPLNLMKSF